jgi:hypothetical protein
VPDGPWVVLDRIAAVVGDDVILEAEVDRMAAVELVPRRPGEDDAAYRDRILNERIDEVVEEQQLRRTGGADPDPREVEAKLDELAARLSAAPGGTLEVRMARAHVVREDVKGWIRRGLMLAAYVRERISPQVKTTEAELRAFFDGPFRAEAKERGLETLPSFADVQDRLRELVRERKLNEAVERWTRELREATRILIYRRPGRPGSAAGTSPSR